MKYIFIILISVLISLPSLANVEGKGIICECVDCKLTIKKSGYLFINNQVERHHFYSNKNEINILISSSQYVLSTFHIRWKFTSKDVLDRKTLLLQRDNGGKYFVRQCKVLSSIDEFKKEIDILKSNYQKELNLKIKENKI
jgi:hypothetical protein